MNWRDYWNRFRETHGDPVPYKGRLLFADGWMYSATDYRGPEWAPPEDEGELRKLQLHYWLVRRRIVDLEHRQLWTVIKQIKETRASRSAPVRAETTTFAADDQGKMKMTRQEVDEVQWERTRLKWLKDDISNCERMIERIKENKVGVEEESVAFTDEELDQ